MTMLMLARHGQTDWNLERRWQGHADPPLNETGRAESRALAVSLANVGLERVYSSDLARARETAEIVGSALELEVLLDPRLREVDVGEWSGLTSAEVAARFPDGYRRRHEGSTGWERGEPFEAMAVRVVAAVLSIAAAHADGRLLVITHGGPLRALWTAARGERSAWVNPGNCDVDAVAVERDQMRWIHSSRGGLHQQVQA
jgi:broad specificity phosphatase PhoE